MNNYFYIVETDNSIQIRTTDKLVHNSVELLQERTRGKYTAEDINKIYEKADECIAQGYNYEGYLDKRSDGVKELDAEEKYFGFDYEQFNQLHDFDNYEREKTFSR